VADATPSANHIYKNIRTTTPTGHEMTHTMITRERINVNYFSIFQFFNGTGDDVADLDRTEILPHW